MCSFLEHSVYLKVELLLRLKKISIYVIINEVKQCMNIVLNNEYITFYKERSEFLIETSARLEY